MMLPEAFLNRMKDYLGPDFGPFLACYDKPAEKGIRINTLKANKELVGSYFKQLRQSPFSPLSFFADRDKLGDMPLHSAGAFYSQEPSAASAVTVLNPQPGDFVLDLCAAPGGKSTQIAAQLMETGLLWSNEIVKSRANILLSNIERMGVRNCVVSSCHPQQLCGGLRGFFDKVLVDAPCSGEGMFRKDIEAVEHWSPEHVKSCAGRQLSILRSAAPALKEGGILVYSTCTFSFEENEGVVQEFLKENPEFELLDPGVSFGREAMGINARRILPMDGGEGHFVAKLIKHGGELPLWGSHTYLPHTQGESLYRELFTDLPFGCVVQQGERLLILPPGLPQLKGLGVIRAGVELGEIRGKRIEPSHQLFSCQKSESCRSFMNFNSGDESLARYLMGEEIPAGDGCSGFTGVAVESVMLGFGKASGGMLKNRYPKGLRLRYVCSTDLA